MSALNTTSPVPAVSVRSFAPSAWLSIGAYSVKTMPPALAPVLITASVFSVTAPLKRTSSSVVVNVIRSVKEPPPLRTIPVEPMAPLVPKSISYVPAAPSPDMVTWVTGVLSAPPKVTPLAFVTINRPKAPFAAVPMSALNTTSPVPAARMRSFACPAWLSIGAYCVNTMSPAPAPVSIVNLVLSVTAPLKRTSSSVVVNVIRSVKEPPPLRTIPVEPMAPLVPKSISYVPAAPSPDMVTWVTGVLSAPPKVTPLAFVTINPPRAPPPAVPMLALKMISPVPAVRVRIFASLVSLLIVPTKVMAPSPMPVLSVTSWVRVTPVVKKMSKFAVVIAPPVLTKPDPICLNAPDRSNSIAGSTLSSIFKSPLLAIVTAPPPVVVTVP